MSFEQSLQSIRKQVKQLRENPQFAEKSKLPGNAYFLPDNSVLCLPRGDGEARYPYSYEGFTLWAYASGSMYVNESTFTSFLQMPEGSEPKIAFFAGLEKEDGGFEPLSLLSVPAQQTPIKTERYTVFTPKAVYYITETAVADFAVRVYVTEQKEIFFSIYAENKREKPLRLYLASFFNPFLRYEKADDSCFRWFKECRANGGDFVFTTSYDVSRTQSLNNYGILNKYSEKTLRCEQTASRINFMGGKNNSFAAAEPLFTGNFSKNVPVCCFTDIAVAGDISHFSLEKSLRLDFRFTTAHDELALENARKVEYSAAEIDEKLMELEKIDEKNQEKLKIHFGAFTDGTVKEDAFNSFLEYVKRQVEFCALGKTYGGNLLGIRDVFQHLEALIMWRPEACAEKILEALSYTDPSGRCPRQYSIPAEGKAPRMDLRPYIDQGVWVISTIATYLKYTKDYDFLNRICGYYEIVDEDTNTVRKSELTDSVLDHLMKIMDYLIDNRDKELTKCVCAMYGDWNDALDGLGVSMDPNKKYGTGVSVMATLQVYQNLEEMVQILSIVDSTKFEEQITLYQSVREEIAQGLNKYAVVENNEGRKHILQGWGDKRSYLVGSFSDPDGVERYSLTASAYWVLSNFYDRDPSIRETILETYRHLDSKYGLMTFDKYFPVGTPGVGRIPKLPAGTAENAAAYIHGSMFGVASLFKMGESREGWRQLEKSIPITHQNISVTPFVMPNSYCHNEELLIDGESMSDWHTGSANVLLKTLMRYGFGVEPLFEGVNIQPASVMPVQEFDVELEIRGCKITYRYRNQGNGTRRFIVNGEEQKAVFDEIMRTYKLHLPDEAFQKDSMQIEIID